MYQNSKNGPICPERLDLPKNKKVQDSFEFLTKFLISKFLGMYNFGLGLEPPKVIHPKYYKHLKKGACQSHLGRQKWAGFWQISLYIK